MELSDFAFKIVFTFLPGIISLIVIDALTIHKKWDKLNYLLYSFVLGLVNYLIWFLISKIECLAIKEVDFLKNIADVGNVNVEGVVYVTVFLSIPVGLILVYIINHKLMFRIAKRIRASRKIGDIDVWSYTFNTIENTEWVVIRDFENDLMYTGWVAAFSETDERDKDELFIKDVEVYVNSTAELLYKTPGMYFAAERGKVTIEFPNLK